MAANIVSHRVGPIAIAGDDVGTAVEFSRGVLGLQLLFEAPPGLAFNRPTADRERLHSDCVDSESAHSQQPDSRGRFSASKKFLEKCWVWGLTIEHTFD